MSLAWKLPERQTIDLTRSNRWSAFRITICLLAALVLPAHLDAEPIAEDRTVPLDSSPAKQAKAVGATRPEASESNQPAENKYVRILRTDGPETDDGHPKSLQTSICSFHNADGTQQVDLIGAVHIGERSYYQELNRRFEDYDALLYELVAPEGTRVPKGGGEPGSAVGYLQTGMTQMLGLDYQLKEVDYTPENFVHADMTPEEFSASMKRREESVVKMFFRSMGQSLVQQSQPENRGQDARMVAAMLDSDREHALRVVLAEQFSNLDGATLVFGGPDGSTLITERNKKALRVLKRELAKGKKKIGIFYGAGHLEDMAERLEKEFGMRAGKCDWLTAWNLQPSANDTRP